MSRKTTTVTLVNISDVYDHLELTNQEVEWIADKSWSNVHPVQQFAPDLIQRCDRNAPLLRAYGQW